MEKIKIKSEIEIKDIINIILVIVGGVLTFYLVNSISTRNDTIRTKQIMINELIDLYPSMKMKYTNQFSSNKDTLLIRVYMKNEGKYPIFYTSPNLYLISKKDTIQYYKTPDLYDYHGTISPNQEMKIEYSVYGYALDSIPEFVRMTYPVNIEKNLADTYADLLSSAIQTLDREKLKWITHISYNYGEETINMGKNEQWDSFFSNP
jgi:hypothetical protein